jgi:hypothetical protein
MYRNRNAGLKLVREPFVSMAAQWHANSDLYRTENRVAASLEYDLKHRPIDVHDHNGLIRFMTEPWENIGDFLRCRNAWEKFRKGGHLLKTAADWHRFVAHMNGATKAKDQRTPFQELALRALAHAPGSGFTKLSPTKIAKLFTSATVAGVASRDSVNNVTRRTRWTSATAPVFPQDMPLIEALKPVIGSTEIARLADLDQSDPETADLCRPVELVDKGQDFESRPK